MNRCESWNLDLLAASPQLREIAKGSDRVSANGDDGNYDDDNYPRSSPEGEPKRDTKVDEAKEVIIKEVFDKDPRTVMYERQLLVRFEDRFFHWITARALGELYEEGQI